MSFFNPSSGPRAASTAKLAASLAAALFLTLSSSVFARDECKAPGCAATEPYHGGGWE